MNKKERELILKEIEHVQEVRNNLNEVINCGRFSEFVINNARGQKIGLLKEIEFLRELLKGVK